jgi:hypothetical protein
MLIVISHQAFAEGIITKMFREFKKLNPQKVNDPMKKCANELIIAFSKEEDQMTKKHMKKCSLSLDKK